MQDSDVAHKSGSDSHASPVLVGHVGDEVVVDCQSGADNARV